MIGKQSPTGMRVPPTCGLCGNKKQATKKYTFTGKFGVVSRVVDLCEHCDLTPEQPRRFDGC